MGARRGVSLGKASDLRQVDHGFESRPGTTVY